MKTNLLKVSIRQGAVYVPQDMIVSTNKNLSVNTLEFLINIKKLGYTVSEELLNVLNNVMPNNKLKIFNFLSEVTGSKLNWAPLVKGWDTPTGESRMDHIITFFCQCIENK